MPVTYAASTELDAVNQILSSVGQAPVTTLDLQNPEVAIVLTTLREVSKQVQSEGWTFNLERHYVLKPDTNSKESFEIYETCKPLHRSKMKNSANSRPIF